jgi:hypothetical protein
MRKLYAGRQASTDYTDFINLCNLWMTYVDKLGLSTDVAALGIERALAVNKISYL